MPAASRTTIRSVPVNGSGFFELAASACVACAEAGGVEDDGLVPAAFSPRTFCWPLDGVLEVGLDAGVLPPDVRSPSTA
jgi:hypothetical protein